MKKTIVIIAYTKKDILWSYDFLKLNSDKKVYIITPTIEGQSLLRKLDINPFLWYEIEEYEQFYILNKNKNRARKSYKLVKFLENNIDLRHEELINENIIIFFKDSLKLVYHDIIHGYILYKNILNKWNPDVIYTPYIPLSNYKTANENFFSLAFYIQKYFSDKSVKLSTYQSGESKIFKKRIKLKLSYLNQIYQSFQKLYYLIQFNLIKKEGLKSGKKNILMETGGTIISYYYDLYKIAYKESNFNLVTYKTQLSQQIPLYKERVPFIDFYSQWDKNNIKIFKKSKKILTEKITQIRTLKFNTEISWIDAKLDKAIKDQTIIFILDNIASLIKKILVNKKLLKELNPDIIINSHDPSPTGLSLVIPARENHIPSVLLLHGIPIGQYHSPIYSDYLVTWGKKTLLHFQKYSNIEKGHIFSSGFPMMDRYIDKLKDNIGNQKTPKINNKLKFGLLLTNYHPNDSYLSKFLYEVIYYLKDIKNIQINYRMHEGYFLSNIKQLGNEFNVKTDDQSEVSLDQFIKNNDIFLSLDTTAIFWPMIYKKPLIYTSPIWGNGSLPIKKYRAAYIPNNPSELLSIIKKYISNPEFFNKYTKGQLKFLDDYAGPLNGKSSYRLYKILEKKINKENTEN